MRFVGFEEILFYSKQFKGQRQAFRVLLPHLAFPPTSRGRPVVITGA